MRGRDQSESSNFIFSYFINEIKELKEKIIVKEQELVVKQELVDALRDVLEEKDDEIASLKKELDEFNLRSKTKKVKKDKKEGRKENVRLFE